MTTPSPTPNAARRRGAAATTELLLSVARRRFAVRGYAATTVRDITEEAGVNVALVNRYFGTKEALFEACLANAAQDLTRSVAPEMSVDELARTMAAQIAGQSDLTTHRLRLLLRSSGDEGAERIRLGVLHDYAERLATSVGWRPDAPGGDDLLLRAQIVLSAVLGLVVMRSSSDLEPLASVSEERLREPLHDLVTVLLARS